ncbi:MAG TPA: aspartyl/asparaginyl beta-hydroxylase domain-containing protein [Steroidobacteraceae bacterium]|nr:aspartyl/asparaginyl beta-hydroxylase domain-containing protein [Steroidobacteraceae bacterium]
MADAVEGGERALTPEARLDLAAALEAQQDHDRALLAYYRAIIEAQRTRRWLDAGTTAPELLGRVTYAMRYVKAGRRRVFNAALAPIYERHGRDALARFDACLAIQVGERRAEFADPRQRPSMLYFPGLPAAPWHSRADFPWLETLERETPAIREELLAVMPRSDRGERVFLSDEAARRGLASGAGAPSWNGFYFWRHGERRDANHTLCPRTSAVLESLPLVRIRGNAPEVMFSVLTPGTHILPHRGVTNTRAVCHLPLVVPEDCALVVGGEARAWREGEAVVFDDTYEHEAWNRGSRTRVVLIIDVWHPHLTAAERDAVARLAEVMGDFSKAAGI